MNNSSNKPILKFKTDLLLKIMTGNGSFTYFQLVKKLNIPRNLNRDFSYYLKDITFKAIIFKTYDDNYYVPKKIKTIEGIIKVASKGFAFVDIKDEDSIFIPAIYKSRAFNGDEVIVNVYQDDKDETRFFGAVSEIKTRNTKTIVGYITKNGAYIHFIPTDPSFNNKYKLVDIKEEMHLNKYVEMEVVDFEDHFIKIKIIKIIGPVDSMKSQIDMFIRNQGVKNLFEESLLSLSHEIPQDIKHENVSQRKDYRNNLIVTIDGESTKDFDDAIEVYKKANGNYILAVHIADVSHYVKESDLIDAEALIRGTSIYLVDRVIPMLPEALSNGICSLNPNVDRLTISAEIEIDKNGKTVSSKVFEGIINSKHRLTYNKVNDFLHQKITFEDKKLNEMLNLAYELSLVLRKSKKAEGYIDFEIEESKIILDDELNTIDIVVNEKHESEILIEDFMVRANETIATILHDKKIPSLYRIHEHPTAESFNSLQNVLKILNIDVKIKESSDPRDFSLAIEKIKKIRFDDFLKIIMLRTMQKAIYSKDNIGHFGLASKFYTHFTSPIRRYPDLIVHRILREVVINKNKDYIKNLDSKLTIIGETSSAREVDAVNLERKINDVKKAEFMKNKIGKKYSGQIVSIKKFGFFVEFTNKIDVLISTRSLPGRDWSKDENNLFIKNSKQIYKVGDIIDVVIVGTNALEGKVDAVPADHYEEYKKNLCFQKRR